MMARRVTFGLHQKDVAGRVGLRRCMVADEVQDESVEIRGMALLVWCEEHHLRF